MLKIICYSIYHSSNAYLGILMANQELAGFPIEVERRPLCIPKTRGVKVADFVGSKETPVKSEYHREDCARWAKRYGIELHFLAPGVFAERADRWQQSPFDREELPARAYYAARGTGKEARLDQALFRAAWVEGLDVNEESVIRHAASLAGLDPDRLIAQALQEDTRRMLESALAAFERDRCPGVPTWVLNGERFWGKDRVEWLVERVKLLTAVSS
ncbi:MAG: DsbA family protein [Deltaproteobacteria bacterium]|nr:DsbA family protein [Deltaproteobacteria bacterium]